MALNNYLLFFRFLGPIIQDPFCCRGGWPWGESLFSRSIFASEEDPEDSIPLEDAGDGNTGDLSSRVGHENKLCTCPFVLCKALLWHDVTKSMSQDMMSTLALPPC